MTPLRRNTARCPRGHGRLLFQQDKHGAYLSCLWCGFVLDGPPAPREWTEGHAGRATLDELAD